MVWTSPLGPLFCSSCCSDISSDVALRGAFLDPRKYCLHSNDRYLHLLFSLTVFTCLLSMSPTRVKAPYEGSCSLLCSKCLNSYWYVIAIQQMFIEWTKVCINGNALEPIWYRGFWFGVFISYISLVHVVDKMSTVFIKTTPSASTSKCLWPGH